MKKIFISGSADGLGFLAAQDLLENGHSVFLHARSSSRAKQLRNKLSQPAEVFIADLSNLAEIHHLAGELNREGGWDAIIHNAGIYRGHGQVMFRVNVLAPYLLTSLVALPDRLIYLSSGMHRGGRPIFHVTGQNQVTYSDSKFQLTTLMKVVARLKKGIFCNAVDPGWVPTKMGGPGAPDDLTLGYQTQTWLATSENPEALVTGGYFYHQKQQEPAEKVHDVVIQNKLLEICAEISGIEFLRDNIA